MKKSRYVNDGNIYFYQVVVVLRDGTIIKEMFDSVVNNIDAAWNNYPDQVLPKYEGKVDTYGLNQISKHDPRAKKYMKENNIHVPSSVPEIVKLPPLPKVENTGYYIDHDPTPGKYRSNPMPRKAPTEEEIAEFRRKNERGTRG